MDSRLEHALSPKRDPLAKVLTLTIALALLLSFPFALSHGQYITTTAMGFHFINSLISLWFYGRGRDDLCRSITCGSLSFLGVVYLPMYLLILDTPDVAYNACFLAYAISLNAIAITALLLSLRWTLAIGALTLVVYTSALLHLLPQVQVKYTGIPAVVLSTMTITGILCVFKHNRTTSERRLRQAIEDAQLANQSKGEFLANMSHEIRTPMNIILGMSQVLNDRETNSENRGLVQDIHHSASQLLRILNDILDFSKLESKHVQLESEVFDLHEHGQGIVRSLGIRVSEAPVDLEFVVSDAVPRWVRGDALRLRQILLNIMGNAIKFTEKGQVSLNIDGSVVGKVVQLKIDVQDTGIGMTQEQCQRVFEKFRQADNSTTRRFGGTGLGLAIAKDLCELMGGSISVSSELGKGTSFEVQLELSVADAPEKVSSPSQTKASDDEQVGRLEGSKILLVDDNALNLKLAKIVLEQLKCEVTTAKNGREAVDLAVKQRYDAILMDCHMPTMDGYEATRLLRSQESRDEPQVIIAMTASVLAEDRQRCTEAGMDDFVPKPFQREQLAQTLSKWVN